MRLNGRSEGLEMCIAVVFMQRNYDHLPCNPNRAQQDNIWWPVPVLLLLCKLLWTITERKVHSFPQYKYRYKTVISGEIWSRHIHIFGNDHSMNGLTTSFRLICSSIKSLITILEGGLFVWIYTNLMNFCIICFCARDIWGWSIFLITILFCTIHIIQIHTHLAKSC